MGRLRKAAIVLAGGRGTRMGTDIPKQFLELGGRPLIWYTLDAFERSEAEVIVLVVPPGSGEGFGMKLAEEFGFRKVLASAEGGRERYDSVYAGLKALSELINKEEKGKDSFSGNEDGGAEGSAFLPEDEWLLAIQDGARCMVTPELIARGYADAGRYGASVIAVPSKDTVKISSADGFSEGTPDRSTLWIVQTPQTFRLPLIRHAYDVMMSDSANQKGITDDAMAVERFTGTRVRLTMGDYRNIKVTTAEDLETARLYLALDKNHRFG